MPVQVFTAVLALLALSSHAAAARDTYLFGGQRQTPLINPRSLAENPFPVNAIRPLPYLGHGPVVTGGYAGYFGGYGLQGYGLQGYGFGYGIASGLAPAPAPASAPAFVVGGSDLIRPAPLPLGD